MVENKNQPFIGSVWNVRGNIYHQYPNRRRRRWHLNAVPNSTKVGKQGKGVQAPIRSIKQLMNKEE
jgi:hypothetical protein